MTALADLILDDAAELRDAVAALDFAPPVTHVYHPLDYAWPVVEQYVRRFAQSSCHTIMLGMNPGPWGMAQCGVPFGEVNLAQSFLGLDGAIARPAHEHPKRPVDGWACARSEVSGRRLWSWVRDRFQTPDAFFAECFVWNYCPLAFLEDSGRNRTPDKLPRAERDALFAPCDRCLRQLVTRMAPRRVIGIGGFATRCAERVVGDLGVDIGTVLHPSPASPAANRGWAEQADAQLTALGVVPAGAP